MMNKYFLQLQINTYFSIFLKIYLSCFLYYSLKSFFIIFVVPNKLKCLQVSFVHNTIILQKEGSKKKGLFLNWLIGIEYIVFFVNEITIVSHI